MTHKTSNIQETSFNQTVFSGYFFSLWIHYGLNLRVCVFFFPFSSTVHLNIQRSQPSLSVTPQTGVVACWKYEGDTKINKLLGTCVFLVGLVMYSPIVL